MRGGPRVKDIVIFGASAFAEIAHYYFERDSEHRVAAFTVDGSHLKEPTYKGLPVVPFEEIETDFPPDRFGIFVAMGMQEVNGQRAAKTAEAEARGYTLVSFLSSKARVASDLVVMPNTMIMEYAFIQPFVTVGRDTIIWSSSTVGFHSRIGDHCWIVCSLLGESVTVDDRSFLGLNATIAPFVNVGKRNIIGAGALILKDTNDDQIYRGNASESARASSHRMRNL